MNEKRLSMNPFPGLRPFRQDEDYLFFGREEQTMELLQRLGDHRFVAVVGTSGSGKSSLVRCGLLSELLGGKLLRAGAAWEVAITHPGGNPLALLAEALLEADLYDRQRESARENLLATLSRSHFGLVEAVKQAHLGDDTNFLLIVDQFEEIFRFNEAGQMQQEVANEFVSMLLEAVAQTDVPIYIVLTMRSDFIGDCGQFEGLAEMVNRGEFLIPRLSRDQYKCVIEAPIKVAGGKIAPRLLQRLLNDLGQQADQLPCLQHALMRTWSVWAERGDTDALDLEDYQRVGRMSEALSLHADEVFDSLENDRQRQLCAGVFKALTLQESESRGIRRPQRLGGLCKILEAPAEELRPVIDAFRQPGVTFLMPSSEVELTDKTILDISHESLMRVWTRLRRWVEEEAQAVGIYRRLSESAVLHDRAQAGLYRDPELGIALAWREANHPNQAWAERYHLGFVHAMEFLDASQKAHLAEEQEHEAVRQRELEHARMLAEAERERAETKTRAARRLQAMLAGTAVIAVIAVAASLLALYSWRDASLAKQAAELSEQSAKREAERAAAQELSARQARLDAEQNLTRARTAIDSFMINVSESQLLSTPGLQPLRAELLGSASKFYEDFLAKNPDNQGLQAGLADAFYRVGFVNNELGKGAEATQALEKSVALWEAALKANPNDKALRHGLAAAWYESSRARSESPDHAGAYDAARNAARLWSALAELDPGNAEYKKSLARAYNIMGLATGYLGEPERGFLAYQQSLLIRLALLPDHPDDVELLHGLGESFNNLGVYVADSEHKLAMLQRSIEFNILVQRLRPQNVEYALDLGIGYSVTGLHLAAMNRKNEALASYHRGVDHLIQYIRGNPAVPAARDLLSSTLARVRALAIEPEQVDEYTRIFREVRDSHAGLAKKAPEDHVAYAEAQMEYAQQILRVRKGIQKSGPSPAEEAEIVNCRASAVDSLRQAVAAGFKDASRLKRPPLSAASGQAGFAEVLASIEKASPADKGAVLAMRPTNDDVKKQFEQDRAAGYLAFGMNATALDRKEQAREWLEKALAIQQSLAKAQPANEQRQTGLRIAEAALEKLYFVDGRLAKACELSRRRIASLEMELKAKPNDAELAARLADLHRAMADGFASAALWEEATPHYAAAIKRQPQSQWPEWSVNYVEILNPAPLLLVGDEVGYRTGCAKVLAKFGADANPEHAARVARLCALRPGVVTDFSKIVALAEKAKYGWLAYSYALVLYRAGRFEEAIQAIELARAQKALDGVFVDGFVLAMAQFQIGRRDKAIEVLSAVNALSPRSMYSWNHHAYNMLDVDWILLRREANELIHGSPYSVDDRLRRGRAFGQLNEPDKAEAECAAAVKAAPKYPAGHAIHALVLARMGKLEQAARELKATKELLDQQWAATTGDVVFWQTYGEALRMLKRDAEAVHAFHHAIAAQALVVLRPRPSKPDRALLFDLQESLADALQAAGRPGEAQASHEELALVAKVFGLPPLIRDANDLLVEDVPGSRSIDEELAGIKLLLATYNKRLAIDDPIRIHLSARLHHRQAEALRFGGRSKKEISDATTAALKEYERLLVVDPNNASAASGLADLMLSRDDVPWTILKPIDFSAKSGTTLTLQSDGSILASGTGPSREVYAIKARLGLSNMTAVRLETLPHPSLPKGGSGRDPNGSFLLHEFTVGVARPGDPAGQNPLPLQLQNAVAGFHRITADGTQHTIRNAIDGNPGTAWDPWPEVRTRLEAVFELSPSTESLRESTLVIELTTNGGGVGRTTLGCFRLAVTDAPNAYQREEQRIAAQKLTDPWAKLAAAYVLAGDTDRAADLLAKLADKAGAVSLFVDGFSFDGILDSLRTRRPDLYAKLLPGAANVAAERGQIAKARSLYERLVVMQPENGLWKERMDQLQSGVLAHWNFDAGLGQWGGAYHCELSVKDGVLTARTIGDDPWFLTSVSGPAGGKAVVMRYRTDDAFTMQVFWADSSGPLSDVRHLDYPVPASGGDWREITLPFPCQAGLNTLRLDPNTARDHPLEIDSIVLREIGPADFSRLVAEAIVEPEMARLTRDIESNPKSVANHNARGTLLCQLGRWRDSVEDFANGLKLNPRDRIQWTRLGTSLALAGDEEAYRRHCQAMVEAFRGKAVGEIADSICKVCLLRPRAIELSVLPVQALQAAVADPKLQSLRHWFIACCALVSYRQANHEEAIAWTKKHPNLTGFSGALALVVRAMAEHQLGQADQARKTLAQAEAIIPADLSTLGVAGSPSVLPVRAYFVYPDWLAPEILRREAVALMKRAPPSSK